MKSNGSKKRDETVNFIVNAPDGRLEFIYDHETGRMGATNAERYVSERSYERANRRKVLTRVPSIDNGAYFNADDAINKNYDLLIAIDTNSQPILNRDVSITGVTVSRPVWAATTNGALERHWQYFSPFLVEFEGLRGEREKVGWSVALQILQHHQLISQGMRVGIVVDAYLSEHEGINARKRTFDGYNFLRPGWMLIYASSDAGSEALVNKLIRSADNVARRALNHLRHANIPPPDRQTKRRDIWDAHRILIPKNSILATTSRTRLG